MSVLLILERNLHNEMGHAQSQIRSIAQFSSANRIDIVTWSGVESLPLAAKPDNRPERVHLHPVFVSSREALHSSSSAELAAREAKTLNRIATNGEPSAAITFVIPSATTHDLRVAIAVAAHEGPRVVARILALTDLSDLPLEVIDALRDHQRNRRIHLCCETEEMCEAVLAKFGISCPSDFVLPCNVLPDDDIPVRVRSTSFRVGMLGGPRGEKGSFRLPSMVRSIASQSRKAKDAPKVTIVVQVSLNLRARTLSMLAALLRAKLTPGNPRIEVIWGAQSSEDYRHALFGLGCVLLPYRLERYGTSGSGMIIDAVNAGVPVIRTRGMAMSQPMSFGNGLEATTDDEFATAILKMAADPELFLASAKLARKAMQERAVNLPFS